MTRKVIIDCDPGIDDAVALAMALFDPRLEVVAVTACAGTVDAGQSTRNVQALIERLDPPRFPRIGSATDPDGAAVGDNRELHGENGLGPINWAPVGRQHVMSSEKLLADRLRADPGKVTIVCLGPLTGIAGAFQRDPSLAELVDRIVMVGGSVEGIGDITSCAEFNMHFDPKSAAQVFHSATTKTLLPLDATKQFSFGLELLDDLPQRDSRVGDLLHQVIPYLFRTYRQHQGRETISLASVLAILLLTDPVSFESEEMAGMVETTGELTRGMTLFDRRGYNRSRNNMEVVTSMDLDAVRACFLHSIRFAGQSSC